MRIHNSFRYTLLSECGAELRSNYLGHFVGWYVAHPVGFVVLDSRTGREILPHQLGAILGHMNLSNEALREAQSILKFVA